MATGAAAGDGMFRNVFEGCISGCDTGIERRPYHRNCGCALHKSRGKCSHSNRSGMNVSYPIRRSWSDGCLALAAAAAAASRSASPSPSSTPAVAVANLGGRRNSHLRLCREEDEDDDIASLKV